MSDAQKKIIDDHCTPEWASKVTDPWTDFEANGRVIRDGSDLPRLGRAEKIMKLAVAFGVQPAL